MPQVTCLSRLAIHDGGALSAIFFDAADQVIYCLMFQTENNIPTPATLTQQYRQPMLGKYDIILPNQPQPSPQEPHPISWSDARLILECIRPHITEVEPQYHPVFVMMAHIAARNGQFD